MTDYSVSGRSLFIDLFAGPGFALIRADGLGRHQYWALYRGMLQPGVRRRLFFGVEKRDAAGGTWGIRMFSGDVGRFARGRESRGSVGFRGRFAERGSKDRLG